MTIITILQDISMKKINVVFDVAGKNESLCQKQLNEFLRIAFREFAASYNIVDYQT